MDNKKRLVVIGAGPGGYAAAFYAADMGMDVILIDKKKHPGGTCLFEGCIPSKALLHASRLIQEAKHASSIGIEFGKPRIHPELLRQWKGSVVEKLTSGLGQLSSRRKIRYIQGTAAFAGPHSVEVVQGSNGGTSCGSTEPEAKGSFAIAEENGSAAGSEPVSKEIIEFDYAVIATGSVPADIPALLEPFNEAGLNPADFIWNSSCALELSEIPERLLVIGGGYIGLELGSVYSSLGSAVSVTEAAPGLIAGADKELLRPLESYLSNRFEKIWLNTRVISVIPESGMDGAAGKGATVTMESSESGTFSVFFNKILVSVGRKPYTEGLSPAAAGVRIQDNGFITADASGRTDAGHIYAIGDVSGQPMLAHVASHKARTAVDCILGNVRRFSPFAIPAVIFTDPEIAWTGLNEAEAKEKGFETETVRYPWAASSRAMTFSRTEGLTKLLIEKSTGRILGGSVVGAGAGELIAEITLAAEKGLTAHDLAGVIHAHPTLSETVMEAAELFEGTCTHIYKPKRRN